VLSYSSAAVAEKIIKIKKKEWDVELEQQVGLWCGSSLQTDSITGLSRDGFFLCTELQDDPFA